MQKKEIKQIERIAENNSEDFRSNSKGVKDKDFFPFQIATKVMQKNDKR